jgi:non-specific serine/threonine protein kinase
MEDRAIPTPDEPTLPVGGPAPGAAGTVSGAPPARPDAIGAYPILRELGRGGMGVVYLARDRRLEREIALKLLPPELDDAAARERFLGEARTLAALNHPNIAMIYSLEDSSGRHFITMELVEGRSLSERLRGGAPPLDESLAVLRQIARAVEAAHSKGVVHRDLKPSNVMLQADGTVKVLDFGLAVRLQFRALDPAQLAPGAGEVAGTPGYMSPEQVHGEAADPRADVWAVGCLLYECLFGRPLISGEHAAEKLAATTAFDSEVGLENGARDADLPPRLALLLKRCLAPRAVDRFASMREVRLLLEEEIADRALPRAAETRPATAEARPVPGNLPRRLTSFVGRARDLDETARLLHECRLVTITGAGGCGKSRLSLELASRMLAACPDGVWLVELASLADPAMVPASAAAALGALQAPGTSTLDALLQFLREKRVLVVLDNCEHLLDACADLVGRVLTVCPRVRILATSRESLRVEGEAVYTLAPLGLPQIRAQHGPASARNPATAAPAPSPTPTPARPGRARVNEDTDAVLLFVDRARAVLPSFAIDDTNRPAIHEICRRLDGIPLAIELAAARVKTLPVEKIRDLLDDRFRLLTRGSRGAQPHQATLRALIDWSYDRLDAREQAVFRRLSVFRGAWALDAVEAVAAGGDVEAWDVLDLFTRLVEKSLVVRDVATQGAGSARYYMLETVRAYAGEKLHESGDEEPDALRRHRDHVVALSVEGELGLRGRDQAQWDARLRDAVDDVRSVLELVAHDPDVADAGLRLVGSFWFYWLNRGMWQEGRDAIARALAHPAANPNSMPFGRALVAAGNLAFRMGDLERSRRFYADALPVLSSVGTDVQVGSVYLNLGNIAYSRGEYDEAERMYETSLDRYRRANSTFWIAGCLTNLSALALAREDIDRVETMQSEALAIYETAGIRDQIGLCLLQLGIAAVVRGDPALARARWDRALTLGRELDHGWLIIAALSNLAFLELSGERLAEARDLLIECVSRLQDMRDPAVALAALEAVARVAAETSPAEAAALLAAATALRGSFHMPLVSYERQPLQKLDERLASALGGAELTRVQAAGRRMSLEEALSAAQALLERPA